MFPPLVNVICEAHFVVIMIIILIPGFWNIVCSLVDIPCWKLLQFHYSYARVPSGAHNTKVNYGI